MADNKTREQWVKELQEIADANELYIEPARKELELAKQKFKDECKKLEAPLNKKMNEFYDTFLLDSKGNPVRIGDLITKKGNCFQVVDRGCQFVLGTILNNPQVIVRLRVEKNDIIALQSREKHLTPDDLKEYEKVDLTGKEVTNEL